MEYAAALRSYFMEKMASGELRSIRALVKNNCLINLDDAVNCGIMQGTMFCEPDEYIESAHEKD